MEVPALVLVEVPRPGERVEHLGALVPGTTSGHGNGPDAVELAVIAEA